MSKRLFSIAVLVKLLEITCPNCTFKLPVSPLALPQRADEGSTHIRLLGKRVECVKIALRHGGEGEGSSALWDAGAHIPVLHQHGFIE